MLFKKKQIFCSIYKIYYFYAIVNICFVLVKIVDGTNQVVRKPKKNRITFLKNTFEILKCIEKKRNRLKHLTIQF